METIADWPHLAAYMVAALLIGIFVMIFSNRLFYYREKEINTKSRQMNTQLGLVLDSTRTQVWTYDPDNRYFALLSIYGDKRKEYSAIDFSMLFEHDDFSQLLRIISSISKQEETTGCTIVRSRKPEEESDIQKFYDISVSVLHTDRNGQPTCLLGIQRDITEDKLRTEQSNSLALRYHTVFNSSLVDMVYYDADGVMTDINEKACETFEVKDRDQLLATKPHIYDVPALQDLDFRNMEQFYSSSITELKDILKPIGGLESNYWGEKKTYYEQTMSPIRKENGELAGIVMVGRNITEMVESQHHQKQVSRQLAKKTKDIQEYISNINYSLKVSNGRLINYYPDTHELYVSSDLQKPQYKLEQLRCITLINEEDRKKAKGLFRRMDRRHQGTFVSTLRTLFRDKQGRSIYLTFSMVPVTGKDGTISHYFGMCQDNTEITYTEMRLIKETQKAQETEELKNTFLTNMSYEIRTPLNAVVGFADLFSMPHEEADEPVFAEEIKRNTGELLQLINDILFISRLDAQMVEFNYKDTDFATLFDGFCYMGWSNLNPDVKVTVENPYNHLIVTIDDQNLGTIIQKLCLNAARHTYEGTIRAKYEYRRGELAITIEDTGDGLSEEMQKHIFDRFAKNELSNRYVTGLDMPIIKELTEQMGGSIEIQSEQGKGSTAYISIPCKMSSLEKKSEIIV